MTQDTPLLTYFSVFWFVGLEINPHTKFEVSNFVRSRDIIYKGCAVSRDLRAGGQKRPHIWNPRPQFVYSLGLYNFYGGTMTIKGSLLSGVPIVSDFQSKLSPFFSPKIDVWGP